MGESPIAHQFMNHLGQIRKGMFDTVPTNLPHAQQALLCCLVRELGNPTQGVKASVISKKLGVSQPSITPVICRLEEAGLLKRTDDPNDRRVVLLSVTPKGMEKFRRFDEEQTQRVEDLLAHLCPEQAAQFMLLLQKSADYFAARSSSKACKHCQSTAEDTHQQQFQPETKQNF